MTSQPHKHDHTHHPLWMLWQVALGHKDRGQLNRQQALKPAIRDSTFSTFSRQPPPAP